jgi:hypothetical protein
VKYSLSLYGILSFNFHCVTKSHQIPTHYFHTCQRALGCWANHSPTAVTSQHLRACILNLHLGGRAIPRTHTHSNTTTSRARTTSTPHRHRFLRATSRPFLLAVRVPHKVSEYRHHTSHRPCAAAPSCRTSSRRRGVSRRANSGRRRRSRGRPGRGGRRGGPAARTMRRSCSRWKARRTSRPTSRSSRWSPGSRRSSPMKRSSPSPFQGAGPSEVKESANRRSGWICSLLVYSENGRLLKNVGRKMGFFRLLVWGSV